MKLRNVLLKIHRWAGLCLAGFLIIIGLTGSILAFLSEFETALNPEYRVSQAANTVFKPLQLREQILQRLPEAKIDSLPLYVAQNEALHLWIELPDKINPKEMVLTDLVLNPYTANELSRRSTEIWPVTRKNLMAFIYRIHYSLLLGDAGLWICGLTASIWTIDCFVGLYLTFPIFITSRKGWWSRWKVAWLVRTNLSKYRLNFDLHRAFGLWTFLILFAFAWSGVSFNLNAQIYQPVMNALFGMPNMSGVNSMQHQGDAMAWQEAYSVGKGLMFKQAKLHQFAVKREQSLDFDAKNNTFSYAVLSDKDVSERWGATAVIFDANSGELRQLNLPTGNNAGKTFTTWIQALHTAAFWRSPLQFFICFIGLGVITLSITGVYIWLKKRKARKLSKDKHLRIDAELGV